MHLRYVHSLETSLKQVLFKFVNSCLTQLWASDKLMVRVRVCLTMPLEVEPNF